MWSYTGELSMCGSEGTAATEHLQGPRTSSRRHWTWSPEPRDEECPAARWGYTKEFQLEVISGTSRTSPCPDNKTKQSPPMKYQHCSFAIPGVHQRQITHISAIGLSVWRLFSQSTLVLELVARGHMVNGGK